jgi:hypothetical protein
MKNIISNDTKFSNIIASGNYAIKEHWSRGAKTACNRKMSVGKNDTELFKIIVKGHPEKCCLKCLAEFNRINKNF